MGSYFSRDIRVQPLNNVPIPLQNPPGVVGAAGALSERLNALAMDLIEQLREKKREHAASICGHASTLCDLLKSADIGIGVGASFASAFFKHLHVALMLEPEANLLTLDVIMVVELLLKATSAFNADEGAPGAILEDQLWRSKAGAIHTAMLQLALDEARKAIELCKQRNYARKFIFAEGLRSAVRAASNQLEKARGHFFDAIIAGKVLGECVAESVAQKRAEQEGILGQNRSILLSGSDRRARLYARDSDLDVAGMAKDGANANPDEWGELLEAHQGCMAITNKLQPCSKRAQQVFMVHSDRYLEARGGADAQRHLLPSKAFLCVCTQHGTGSDANDGFLVANMGAAVTQKYPAAAVNIRAPREHDFRMEQTAIGTRRFSRCLRVSREDLRLFQDNGMGGWRELVAQLREAKQGQDGHLYACHAVKNDGTGCTAAVKHIYAVGCSPTQVKILCVCGHHRALGAARPILLYRDGADAQGAAAIQRDLAPLLEYMANPIPERAPLPLLQE
ncbi:hypothetical protein Agub_g6837 [Astrephomene gubernaculifera]|uniref:Uncharacterized protein n=1 Tax=Astrephomene gubernaculifera TaxID=47775 RepID=A0AAD3HLX7_9CHLO|nr:hypothetical protein Agub_g6837 [Astrephomene gubernaculifera]